MKINLVNEDRENKVAAYKYFSNVGKIDCED